MWREQGEAGRGAMHQALFTNANTHYALFRSTEVFQEGKNAPLDECCPCRWDKSGRGGHKGATAATRATLPVSHVSLARIPNTASVGSKNLVELPEWLDKWEALNSPTNVDRPVVRERSLKQKPSAHQDSDLGALLGWTASRYQPSHARTPKQHGARFPSSPPPGPLVVSQQGKAPAPEYRTNDVGWASRVCRVGGWAAGARHEVGSGTVGEDLGHRLLLPNLQLRGQCVRLLQCLRVRLHRRLKQCGALAAQPSVSLLYAGQLEPPSFPGMQNFEGLKSL